MMKPDAGHPGHSRVAASLRARAHAQSKTGCNIAVGRLGILAEWTGLEPATPGVTGRWMKQGLARPGEDLEFQRREIRSSNHAACARAIPNLLSISGIGFYKPPSRASDAAGP